MLSEYLPQKFGEGGVAGYRVRERVVSRLSGGGLSSEGVKEFSSTSSLMEVIC